MSAGKGYIICVDDEVAVLETLQEQLRERFSASHEIEIAASAENALSLIEEILDAGQVIEVVISDQVMPGMKGDQFLEQIHRRLPEAIKILLTGQASLEATIRAINYGGLSKYVEKPWNIDLLARDIHELISKFKQNIENQHLIKELNKRIKELEK
ncbi:MAG TPA: response regulator [Leptospiraceae bacterium]|nr:response regulator [Leptospiraceae bacterium]